MAEHRIKSTQAQELEPFVVAQFIATRTFTDRCGFLTALIECPSKLKSTIVALLLLFTTFLMI